MEDNMNHRDSDGWEAPATDAGGVLGAFLMGVLIGTLLVGCAWICIP